MFSFCYTTKILALVSSFPPHIKKFHKSAVKITWNSLKLNLSNHRLFQQLCCLVFFRITNRIFECMSFFPKTTNNSHMKAQNVLKFSSEKTEISSINRKISPDHREFSGNLLYVLFTLFWRNGFYYCF